MRQMWRLGEYRPLHNGDYRAITTNERADHPGAAADGYGRLQIRPSRRTRGGFALAPVTSRMRPGTRMPKPLGARLRAASRHRVPHSAVTGRRADPGYAAAAIAPGSGRRRCVSPTSVTAAAPAAQPCGRHDQIVERGRLAALRGTSLTSADACGVFDPCQFHILRLLAADDGGGALVADIYWRTVPCSCWRFLALARLSRRSTTPSSTPRFCSG